jgi:hypothetical protein
MKTTNNPETKFFLGVGVFQIALYGLFFLLSYTEYITDDKKIMPVLSIVFGLMSLSITAILPLYLIAQKRKK